MSDSHLIEFAYKKDSKKALWHYPASQNLSFLYVFARVRPHLEYGITASMATVPPDDIFQKRLDPVDYYREKRALVMCLALSRQRSGTRSFASIYGKS